MPDRADFVEHQLAFAAHIRDPQGKPAPADIEDRRMAVYRELFYNNVEGFISGTFPVLRSLYRDDDWHRLVREYFANHRACTPLFLEIPREFLTWLRTEYSPLPGDPPFLYQLAHYEWVELALTISEESIDESAVDPHGDLLEGTPVLSPVAWHLVYDFPVHRISADQVPDSPAGSRVYLVVYRTRRYEIGFMEINPVTKRLLELVEDAANRSGRELLLQIAEEMAHPQPDVVIGGGAGILADLAKRDIITGTKRR